MFKNIFLILFISISYNMIFAKDTSDKTGNWTSNDTWSKNIEPLIEDTLVINNGDTIAITTILTYNTQVIILILDGGTLEINGRMNLEPQSEIISTGGNLISTGGNTDEIIIGRNNNKVWVGNMGDYHGNFVIRESDILPIEWGDLSLRNIIQSDGTYVSVAWSTITESNNDFFTIEYSQDLENWYNVDMVPSHYGNSNTETYYNTKFLMEIYDIIYIRIKQTDYDAMFKYSKIIPITVIRHDKSYYMDIFGKMYTKQPYGFSYIICGNGTVYKVFRD